MGRKKCAPPSSRQEILGLVIDSEAMTLSAPTSIVDAILDALRTYGGCRDTTSVETARLLGMLASIEAAVPNALRLARPIYDDLKEALTMSDLADGNRELRIDRYGSCESLSGYEWRQVGFGPSREGKAAATLLSSWLEKMNGQALEEESGSIYVKTDASETGIGGRVFEVTKSGDIFHILTVSSELPPRLLGASSIAREAHAFAETLLAVPPSVIANKVVAGIVDNQGLTKRFHKGARCPLVNEELTRIATSLQRAGSSLRRMMWTNRANMQAEDELSRVNGYQEHPIEVEYEWFAKWWTSVRPRPTIDAFSSATDRKLVPHIAPVWFSSRA